MADNQIRINELARELEIKAKVLIEYLPEIGVTEKKTHSSSIDIEHAELVRKHFRGLAPRKRQRRKRQRAAKASGCEGQRRSPPRAAPRCASGLLRRATSAAAQRRLPLRRLRARPAYARGTLPRPRPAAAPACATCRTCSAPAAHPATHPTASPAASPAAPARGIRTIRLPAVGTSCGTGVAAPARICSRRPGVPLPVLPQPPGAAHGAPRPAAAAPGCSAPCRRSCRRGQRFSVASRRAAVRPGQTRPGAPQGMRPAERPASFVRAARRKAVRRCAGPASRRTAVEISAASGRWRRTGRSDSQGPVGAQRRARSSEGGAGQAALRAQASRGRGRPLIEKRFAEGERKLHPVRTRAGAVRADAPQRRAGRAGQARAARRSPSPKASPFANWPRSSTFAPRNC